MIEFFIKFSRAKNLLKKEKKKKISKNLCGNAKFFSVEFERIRVAGTVFKNATVKN